MTTYANNVAGTLAANIGPSDTLVLLGAGQGVKFPSPVAPEYFFATLVHVTTGAVEVVKCTARAADTLTVERGRDSTTAVAFTTGSVVEMRLCAAMIREIDYRTVRGQANGLASLDATTKIPVIEMPASVPIKDGGGKILVADLPNAVVLETELTPLLDAKVAKAGDTMTGSLLLPSARTTGTAGAYKLGLLSEVIDTNLEGVVGIRGQTTTTTGGIRFGNSTFTLGWDGANLVFGTFPVWHSANFTPANKLDTNNPTATGTLTVQSGISSSGDVTVYRSATPTIGRLYLNSAANRWLGYNGTVFEFSGANVHALDFVSTSDRRLKKRVRRHDTKRGFADHIHLCTWTWKASGEVGFGEIAQRVQEYAPHLVSGTAVLCLDKAGLALEGVVDLAARVRSLEALVERLTKALGA